MKKRGFTIIEVVLVLAIAGLIFLMVFIALPALQRSQRNTRRRQDISRISTAVTQYLASNNKLPFSLEGTTANFNQDFVSHYIDSNATYVGNTMGKVKFKCDKECPEFSDPDGSPYGFVITTVTGVDAFVKESASDNFKNHAIYAANKAKCSGGDTTFEDASGTNDFALAYILEGGSVYCVDNS